MTRQLQAMPESTNFTVGRRQALQATHGALSLRLLETVFDRLVAWPSAMGMDWPGYRDEDLFSPGLCTWVEATILHLLVKYGKFTHPLEIGCAVGWSTVHMALALQPETMLTCVDPFVETSLGLGDYNHDAYMCFMRYVQAATAADLLNLFVDRSPACLELASGGQPFDFVFLDGWHFEGQPQRDIDGLLPLLDTGAIIALHDLHYHDVYAAAESLVKRGWYFTGFFTPNQLAVFWEGDSKSAPRWWSKFLKDVVRL